MQSKLHQYINPYRYYPYIIRYCTHYICYYRKPILTIEKAFIFNEDMDSMSDGNEIDNIDG